MVQFGESWVISPIRQTFLLYSILLLASLKHLVIGNRSRSSIFLCIPSWRVYINFLMYVDSLFLINAFFCYKLWCLKHDIFWTAGKNGFRVCKSSLSCFTFLNSREFKFYLWHLPWYVALYCYISFLYPNSYGIHSCDCEFNPCYVTLFINMVCIPYN